MVISTECSLLPKILGSTSSKETILARNEYPPQTEIKTSSPPGTAEVSRAVPADFS